MVANAETILNHGKHRLDVMFRLRGLRVVIEGKFVDSPEAKTSVKKDARKRVRDHIACKISSHVDSIIFFS